jgi:hypothetical protein
MALGMRVGPYTEDAAEKDAYDILTETGNPYLAYVWDGSELMQKICEAKGITRARFIRSMAIPKPTKIQNLVYSSELRRMFDLSNEPGFIDGVYQLPKGYGILIPKRKDGKIIQLELHSINKLTKPRVPAQT